MAKVLVTNTYLSNIADAIRGKNGTTNTYTPAQMAPAITALTPKLQTKSNISATTTTLTVTADNGFDGLSSVQINPITLVVYYTGKTAPTAGFGNNGDLFLLTD